MSYNQKIENKLKISIVTPNYNYSKYIEQCILSVVQQDYENVEHIIVDDGSTDNSVEIIKKLQEKYPQKIKLIQQENRGQTPAINRGLKEASGEIIGWINSDDYYSPNIFGTIIEIFESKNCDTLYGYVNVVDVNGNYIYKIRHQHVNLLYGVFFGFSKIVTSCAVFWKKDLMRKVGLFNETLRVNMDGEYFSRLFLNASNIVLMKKVISNFRQQKISIAGLNDKNWKDRVVSEVKFEIKNSINYLTRNKKYKYTPISILKIYSLIIRILFRLLSLELIITSFEKIKYRLIHTLRDES